MAKKSGKRNKVNWWILILVIILALMLIFSRSRRAPQRVAPPASSPGSELYSEVVNASKPNDAMTQKSITDFPVALLLGQVDPASDQRLVIIDDRFASRSGMYIDKKAYAAFREMSAAASQQGIVLTIISAMRTFDHQKRIWNGKWNGSTLLQGSILATDISNPIERSLEILRYSAMPGTSRHHWGTDIDLNSLQNSYFASGEGKKIYDWLNENAGKYGFFQPYTAQGTGRNGGYEEEKWHWSYHPLSSVYLESYLQTINNDHLRGFDGWETAAQIDVISNYVMKVADFVAE